MFLKILFVLAVALEFVFVPLFLKYSWPDKCWKSFGYKNVCSALFFFAGILAMQISNNHSPYAKMIIIGLLFGWIGDLFLHIVSDKFIYFGIGGLAFLIGHIFYIDAFSKAIRETYPSSSTVAWYEIVAVVLIVAAVVAYGVVKKIKLSPIMIAVLAYAVTISAMLVKGLRYCIGEAVYGTNDHMVMIFVTVALGAILFVLSDGSLGMILFAGQKKNRPLKIFNIVTYFAAQILLASSIFFISTRMPLGA